MPRPKLFRSNDLPYHVSVQVNNRENFPVSGDYLWRVACTVLAEAAERYGPRIHAFVQMSNHLHILLTTPNGNVDAVMRFFLSQLACRVNAASGRADHLFAARYKWSVLETAYAVAYVLKYVFRNPVRARMAASVASYPYSSYFPRAANPLPLVEGIGELWRLVPRDIGTRLHWLDKPTPKELEELVKRALRRSRFSFSKSKEFTLLFKALDESYEVRDPNPRTEE